MTPELIAILALGLTLIGLLLTLRRDARADNQTLRAELRVEIQNLRADSRAENHALRAEVRSEIQNLREEVHAGDQRLREDVHAEISNLRTDVQSLAERTARLEGVIQGLAATHRDRDRDRHDDAA